MGKPLAGMRMQLGAPSASPDLREWDWLLVERIAQPAGAFGLNEQVFGSNEQVRRQGSELLKR